MRVSVSPVVNELLDEACGLSLRRQQGFVGVEHLFEVIVGRRELLTHAALTPHWRALETAAQHLARNPWSGTLPREKPGEPFFTPRVAAVTAEAARLATRSHPEVPSAGHLLLAIVADALSAPSRTLDQFGTDRGALIQAIQASLSATATPAGSSSPPPRHSSMLTAPIPTKGATTAPREDSSPADPTAAFLTDLTDRAQQGKIEPAIGRNHEITHLLEILTRHSKNNAILIGEAGVGKTKIVEGLALATVKGGFAANLGIDRVVELNMTALMAGTQYRGAFEDKLLGLLEELRRSPRTLLFIDEIHLVMGAGSTDGAGIDMANLLKPALARGEIRCVGATTLDEYRKFITRDPALERRFQMVRIEPLTEDAALEVLRAVRPTLEKHHGVGISGRALKAAIALTQRHMPTRHLPDKALDVLDHACARHRLKVMAARQGAPLADTVLPIGGDARILPHDIRKVVSQVTNTPLEAITADERRHLLSLESELQRRIIGQDEAITRVAQVTRRSRAGLGDPNRPDAAMMLCGPTGVGKTELAKALAHSVYGSIRHLITFDMSAYSEPHSVARLIGAPPGYQGADEEGQLIKAVQDMPYSVVLFDEIEKAHPRVFDVFLPILDEGRLRDSHGREVSFRNCMVLFTSNIGADLLASGGPAGPEALTEALLAHFRPEFINRIDDIVPFHPLLQEDIRAILLLQLRDLQLRLKEKRVGLHVYQRALEHLAEQGDCGRFGARELRRTLERTVVTPVSSMLLHGVVQPGQTVEVLMEDSTLALRVAQGRPEGAAP